MDENFINNFTIVVFLSDFLAPLDRLAALEVVHLSGEIVVGSCLLNLLGASLHFPSFAPRSVSAVFFSLASAFALSFSSTDISAVCRNNTCSSNSCRMACKFYQMIYPFLPHWNRAQRITGSKFCSRDLEILACRTLFYSRLITNLVLQNLHSSFGFSPLSLADFFAVSFSKTKNLHVSLTTSKSRGFVFVEVLDSSQNWAITWLWLVHSECVTCHC